MSAIGSGDLRRAGDTWFFIGPVRLGLLVERFCELRASPGIVARLPRMEPAREKWRETLPPERIAAIEQEFGVALTDV